MTDAPPTKTRAARSNAERATFLALACIASLVVMLIFQMRPGMTGHHRADFPEIMDGSAHRPYVSRALVPLVVRGITAVTPAPLRDSVSASLRGREFVEQAGWYDALLFEFALTTLLMFLCFVGFAYVLKRLTETVYEFPRAASGLAPIVALFLLPLFFRYYSYPYDPATLLLYSLSLLFLLQRRFGWFVLSVALSSANKETSILLIPLFIVHEWLRERRVDVVRLIVVAAVWGVVRGALMWVYRDNPGVMLENHFAEHTVWFFSKFPMAMRYTLVVVALFVIPVRNRWREKPAFLRAGLAVTLVPLVVMGSIFGFIDELRGYYEALPFIYLLGIPSVVRWLGDG